MKAFFIILTVSILSLLFFKSSVFGQANREARSVRVLSVPKGEVINQTFFVKGAEVVEISGVVNGDVIVAGGRLLMDGEVKGDLLAAGGTLVVSGRVSEDVRVVGGDITVSGNVGGNISAVGGSIEITDSAEVAGGVIAAGGNVLISAPIREDVKVFSSSFTLANKVYGNVEVFTDSLRLSSNSEIAGNLEYTSESEASIDKLASISGQVLRKPAPYGFRSENLPTPQKLLFGFFRMRVEAKIISFFAALVTGLLVLRISPQFTSTISNTISLRPWASLGLGIVILIFVPIAVILLFVTIIGIPLAITLLFFYLLSVYFAKIYVSLSLGRILTSKGAKGKIYKTYILGLIGFYLISLIPFVGEIASFIVLLLGMGALYLGSREYYLKIAKAKLI